MAIINKSDLYVNLSKDKIYNISKSFVGISNKGFTKNLDDVFLLTVFGDLLLSEDTLETSKTNFISYLINNYNLSENCNLLDIEFLNNVVYTPPVPPEEAGDMRKSQYDPTNSGAVVHAQNLVGILNAQNNSFYGKNSNGAIGFHQIDLSNYYTKSEVDDEIDNVQVDLSNYYTKSETDSEIEDVTVIPNGSTASVSVGGIAAGQSISGNINDLILRILSPFVPPQILSFSVSSIVSTPTGISISQSGNTVNYLAGTSGNQIYSLNTINFSWSFDKRNGTVTSIVLSGGVIPTPITISNPNSTTSYSLTNLNYSSSNSFSITMTAIINSSGQNTTLTRVLTFNRVFPIYVGNTTSSTTVSSIERNLVSGVPTTLNSRELSFIANNNRFFVEVPDNLTLRSFIQTPEGYNYISSFLSPQTFTFLGRTYRAYIYSLVVVPSTYNISVTAN